MWSLTKFYLHAHRFLYKLDYNSKWNTQEKYPLTSSQEEARLIKGKDQRAKLRGHMEGNWPGPLNKDGKCLREDDKKETSKR